MPETSAAAPAPIKKIAAKPVKVLPTDRIAFPKQLELLRAYAAASGSTGKPATNDEIGKMVGLSASTVSLGNNFFSSAGLLKKIEPGYVPTAAVLDYARAYEWDKQTASHKLASVIRETWFAVAVLPTLKIRAMDEKEAMTLIADAAGASAAHAAHVRMLLQYVEATGLASRQGKQIVSGPTPTVAPATPEKEPDTGNGDGGAPSRDVPRLRVAGAPFAAEGGTINYDVSLRVRMSDMAGWSPERISRFFTGLAQVIAATKEQDDGGT